jgi:hypothetical protein
MSAVPVEPSTSTASERLRALRPRFTAARCQTAEASAELEVRHPIPERWSARASSNCLPRCPRSSRRVRHPVDESKTKPTYSASTIAASVIPAHGPPRCRRPRPNQDRPPSAPAAQTRLSAAAHRVPGRLHHLVDHGHGWRAAARPGPAGAGGWLPGGDAIGGQMAEVWGRSLGPLRWLGGEMQLNREACCCGSRSVSPTTGTTSRCATTSRRLSGPRASI